MQDAKHSSTIEKEPYVCKSLSNQFMKVVQKEWGQFHNKI